MNLLTLEDSDDGIAETEITIYAKIGDMEGLKTADYKEVHEQAETRLNDTTRLRVRKTIKESEPFSENENPGITFNATLKIDNENSIVNSNSEINLPITEEFFKAFFAASNSRFIKTRYVFYSKRVSLSVDHPDIGTIEIPKLKYEVDVFKRTTGEVSEYCKIDIEVDPIIKFLKVNYPDIKDVKYIIKVSHLPFKPNGYFIDSQANEGQMQLLDHLYENDFNYVEQ